MLTTLYKQLSERNNNVKTLDMLMDALEVGDKSKTELEARKMKELANLKIIDAKIKKLRIRLAKDKMLK